MAGPSPHELENLVAQLGAAPTGDLLYNMYAEPACAHNLLVYLKRLAEADGPLPMVLGEAAGPHGCRFSGIAFTSENVLFGSESHLLAAVGLEPAAFRRRGDRSGLPLEREGSASQVWPAIQEFSRPVLIWNTVPFHPHGPEDPMSIRSPGKWDREVGYPFLARLVSLFRPWPVIPVGREAEKALERLSIPAWQYVRHPSNGGAAVFRAQMHQAAEALRGAAS